MMKHVDDSYGFCLNCHTALIIGWETDECVPLPDLPGMDSTERWRLVAIQNLVIGGGSGAVQWPMQVRWLLQLLATTGRELAQALTLLTDAQVKARKQTKEIEQLTDALDDARRTIRHYAEAAQGPMRS